MVGTETRGLPCCLWNRYNCSRKFTFARDEASIEFRRCSRVLNRNRCRECVRLLLRERYATERRTHRRRTSVSVTKGMFQPIGGTILHMP